LCEEIPHLTWPSLVIYFLSVLLLATNTMASAIDREKHSDRDSASLENKIDHHAVQQETISPLNDLADPDAGLSEEERAAEVCFT
jgi:hypothetical protein